MLAYSSATVVACPVASAITASITLMPDMRPCGGMLSVQRGFRPSTSPMRA